MPISASCQPSDSTLTSEISLYRVMDSKTGETLIGFKDQSGKVVVQPAFEYAFKKSNAQYHVIKYNKECGVLNNEGNFIIPLGRYDMIEWCDGLYVCKQGKLYGLVDYTGKELTRPIYSNCNNKNSKRYIGLTLNKYDAIYDCQSQTFLTEFKYPHDDINISINEIGLYDANGKETARYVYYQGRNKNGLNDWYNLTDRKMIAQEYTYILVDYNTQLFEVQKNKKWGLVTIHNEVRVPCIYDELESYYSKSAFVAVKGGKYSLIDVRDGSMITPIEYDHIMGIGIRDSIALILSNGKIGLYNRKSFKEVVPCTYSDAHVYKPDSILVRKNKTYGMINQSGKVIHPFNWTLIGCTPLDTNLSSKTFTYVYKQKKKYGFIKERKFCTPAIYDHVYLDSLDTYYRYYICQRKDTFDIFSNIEYDLPFKLTGYDEITRVTYKYVIVKKDNKYGILNTKDSKELTPVQFEKIVLDRWNNVTVTQNSITYKLIFKADKIFELKEIE